MKINFTSIRSNLIFGLLFLPVFIMAQTSHTVNVTSNVFTPDEITITAGDTVIWTNSQGSHNVNGTTSTFPSNPESFGNEVGSGWTFSHVFTIPGTYDYQCDPHVSFGMTGQIIVEEASENVMSVNFSAMNPHIGQTLWLAVEDRSESEDIFRTTRVAEESFTIEVPGIIAGNDYRIEFFADHNENGSYDAPSTDHAWRIDLDEVSATPNIDFVHNTNFDEDRKSVV